MINTILLGSAKDASTLCQGQKVDCIITSPPYYQLRDYDVEPDNWPSITYPPMPGMPEIVIPSMQCCLGLEPTVEAFIGHMVYILGAQSNNKGGGGGFLTC